MPADLARLVAGGMRERVLAELGRSGYTHVTVDLAGYRRGSLNEILVKTKGVAQ